MHYATYNKLYQVLNKIHTCINKVASIEKPEYIISYYWVMLTK